MLSDAPADHMKTTISKRTFRELAVIASAAPAALDRLATNLLTLTPQLYPFEALRGIVAASLDESETLPNGKLPDRKKEFDDELSNSLSNLLYSVGLAHVPATEIMGEAVKAIREEYKDTAVQLEQFVGRLFGSQALLLSFKATSLREDNENIVLDTKIVVDIRPVFDCESVKTVGAHTLLYRLKITHRTSSDIESCVYTLSQEALDELSETVKRAHAKIDKLKSMPLVQTLGMFLEENK